MKATLAKTTSQNVRITNNGGMLQTSTPITLKNQVTEITSIEDIGDVSEIDVSNGATLVYNSENDKYEIRRITAEDLTINLDGGEF